MNSFDLLAKLNKKASGLTVSKAGGLLFTFEALSGIIRRFTYTPNTAPYLTDTGITTLKRGNVNGLIYDSDIKNNLISYGDEIVSTNVAASINFKTNYKILNYKEPLIQHTGSIVGTIFDNKFERIITYGVDGLTIVWRDWSGMILKTLNPPMIASVSTTPSVVRVYMDNVVGDTLVIGYSNGYFMKYKYSTLNTPLQSPASGVIPSFIFLDFWVKFSPIDQIVAFNLNFIKIFDLDLAEKKSVASSDFLPTQPIYLGYFKIVFG
jgi:hypothetical protein